METIIRDGCYHDSKRTHGLSLDGTSIHSHISEVCQELLCTILGLDEFEKLRCIIYELGEMIELMHPLAPRKFVAHCRPRLSSDENVVSKKAEEEGDIGL